jgi:hypothetical protein
MGNQVPSVYLKQLETEAGLPSNWLDDILSTHLVAAHYLRGGALPGAAVSRPDFDAFYEARSAELLRLIYDAMGVGSADGQQG